MKIKSILAAALLMFSVSAWASPPFRMQFGQGSNATDVTATNPLPMTVFGSVFTYSSAQIANLVAGQATAAGATTIGTPPANGNLRLIHVEIPGNAIQAVAGDDLITIALNGVTVAILDPYIPAASVGTGTLYAASYNFNAIGFNTGSAGTLTVTLTTALTAGAVNINAYFH